MSILRDWNITRSYQNCAVLRNPFRSYYRCRNLWRLESDASFFFVLDICIYIWIFLGITVPIENWCTMVFVITVRKYKYVSTYKTASNSRMLLYFFMYGSAIVSLLYLIETMTRIQRERVVATILIANANNVITQQKSSKILNTTYNI